MMLIYICLPEKIGVFLFYVFSAHHPCTYTSKSTSYLICNQVDQV